MHLHPPPSSWVVIYVDGQLIQQDVNVTEGWNFAGTSRSAIQLYGQACSAVMTRNAPVDADYVCEA